MSADAHFWLTSHNPHVGPAHDDWSIYLRPRDRTASREPQAGDQVLIYEQATGIVDETGKRVRSGREGIVCAAHVESAWQPRKTKTEFTLEAACTNQDWEGYVSREDVNRTLDYAETYTMFGFGGNSGLLRISDAQFTILYATFKRTPRR